MPSSRSLNPSFSKGSCAISCLQGHRRWCQCTKASTRPDLGLPGTWAGDPAPLRPWPELGLWSAGGKHSPEVGGPHTCSHLHSQGQRPGLPSTGHHIPLPELPSQPREELAAQGWAPHTHFLWLCHATGHSWPHPVGMGCSPQEQHEDSGRVLPGALWDKPDPRPSGLEATPQECG